MASISSPNCKELVEGCLRGSAWTEELLSRAIEEDDGKALLSIVVERLADLFEPRLCAVYETLFMQVIARVAPELLSRVRSPQTPRPPPETIDRVYVLSRVTLGADVAVTSVLMDAMKRRYPKAAIFLVGSQKSYEIFAADPRIQHYATPYARNGNLRERLFGSAGIWFNDGIVIDTDSRLTQLGLIRVCDDARYFFFPSRSCGGDDLRRLPDLAAQWARTVFGVADAAPYIACSPSSEPPADITVSLGVGENETKRVDNDFEQAFIAVLEGTGRSLIVDEGLGEAERARVERIILPGMRTHRGSFAHFASLVQQSRLYVGYDSAGGHVASACGVPLISIAKGFANQTMAARWRPKGSVIDGDSPDALQLVRDAIGRQLKS